MAKDVSNKPVSSSQSDNNPASISDQQKVPPLRIVLNTAGNQKSSSNAVAGTANQQLQQQQQSQSLQLQHRQQQELKKEKTDNNVLKSGGKVRIKLGTNKQTSNKSNPSAAANESTQQKVKQGAGTNEKQDTREEINASYSHLRRITRRSQRTAQTLSNEDEESVSSMTSIDENQNTTNSSSDNTAASTTATATASQETAANAVQPAGATGATKTQADGSSNADTPRRYKRRKGETSEYQLTEHDGPFSFQNYKLPMQNSFELYKNIRKQVDKKLKNLSSVQPRTPYGFRDYMLTRGAYVLDGNKLGNGTSLFMNENGGYHQVPLTKYHHALRHNRVNYSLPDRAQVPHGLPVNSPLYNLFVEQEKERHRMRMQHIKEREKLTLATEQEIVRVHNQAAMAAANQLEPFSACTMLKHQEIYNYMDADGFAILAAEDQQQEDQAEKQSEVQTRRGQPQQYEQISPPPTRKNSDAGENPPTLDAAQKDAPQTSSAETTTNEPQKDEQDNSKEPSKTTDDSDKSEPSGEDQKVDSDMKSEDEKPNDLPAESGEGAEKKPSALEIEKEATSEKEVEDKSDDKDSSKAEETSMNSNDVPADKSADTTPKEEPSTEPIETPAPVEPETSLAGGEKSEDPAQETEPIAATEGAEHSVPMDQDPTDCATSQEPSAEHILTDEDRRAYNKEIFLSQLQEIDDKWERIRNEMLIRHRNEAESLHAVQRLEWEWKTKEIGVCDVRNTPMIDNSLVPKLSIYSQDY